PTHWVTLAPTRSNGQDPPFRRQASEGNAFQPFDYRSAGGLAVRFLRVFDQVIENQERCATAGYGAAATNCRVFTARRQLEMRGRCRFGTELTGWEQFMECRVREDVLHAPAKGFRQVASVRHGDDRLARIPAQRVRWQEHIAQR